MKNALLPAHYSDLPAEEYHADKAVGANTLKTILTKSPLHCLYRKESAAMNYGSAFHLAILEPEKFDNNVVRGYEDRRGNKWKELQSECDATGKLLLVESEHNDCLFARDTVHANVFVRKYLGRGWKAESSLFWKDEEFDIMCKCRPDLITTLGEVIDLKTCASASPNDFAKSCAAYLYDLQQAHYTLGCHARMKGRIDFLFLAVEKEPPYASAIYRLSDESFAQGMAYRNAAMKKYKACSDSGVFDGYTQQVVELEIPADAGLAKLVA